MSADRSNNIGDMGLREIADETRSVYRAQKQMNEDVEQWEDACNRIEPLLRANPGWNWRDAIKHLKARGRIPSDWPSQWTTLETER